MKAPRLFIFLLVLGFLPLFSQTENPVNLLKLSSEKCMQLKSMKCTMRMQERVRGKIIYSDLAMKLNCVPYRLYIKQSKPREGLEILYCEGERDNCMLIYTNGFPWVNLTYSPYSNMVHKEAHHNVTHSGLDYIGKIIAGFVKRPTIEQSVRQAPDEMVDGKACFHVTVDDKDYKFLSYTVKKGETIHSIADKFLVAPNSILEKNLKVIDDYDEALYEGEKLLIPSGYGKKVNIWIDKKTYLPLKLVIEDDLGLYEVYEYINLQINPVFQEDEFKEDFDGYGF